MTVEIAVLLAIVSTALLLFATGWLRMDLVALLVLASLAITGLVSAAEAVSGFSNAAVITVGSMFVLSEGLSRAGIADVVGRWLLGAGGRSEARVIAVLMGTAGLLSGFMNSIGVVALLLPVVVRLARKTGIPAPRLLMPLAYGTLLGGLTTVVATATNVLVSTALREAGFAPFGLLDFTPLGLSVLLVATLFVALIGRHLLPGTGSHEGTRSQQDLRAQYGLQERIFAIRVPHGSRLAGRTLAEAALGSVAGLIVIALTRTGRTEALPPHDTILAPGDLLLVQGRLDRFVALRRWSDLEIERETPLLQSLLSEQIPLCALRIAPDSPLVGSTLRHREFRDAHGANVLAIRHDGVVRRMRLAEQQLAADDVLLVQCRRARLAELERAADFTSAAEVTEAELETTWQLQERLFVVRLPVGSELSGVTLRESRLGDAFDFRLLAILRGGELRPMPKSQAILEGGDLLLLQGREEDLDVLRGLQQLEIERDATPYLGIFDQGDLEVLEAVLHPHSRLVGKTAGELRWRERRQVELVAIWREGRPYRSSLDAMRLAAGDALLFVGPDRQLVALAEDPDLIALQPVMATPVDRSKMPLAGGLLLAVVGASLLGWLPISVAALCGATGMVLTRCLRMEEAYQAVDWRSIFLIAGMLPLGIAMDRTGAAAWLAGVTLAPVAGHGPWAAVAVLYGLTALGTVIIPNTVVVVLMVPIALSASASFAIAPSTAMMAVAVAASATLLSPISHPANVLVMGPGDYRFVDYLKLGLPLTALNLVVVTLLLPLLWPAQ